MGNFLHLMYNELQKVYFRKSTWIMYLLVALLIISFGSLLKVFDGYTDARTYGEDWREVLLEENENMLKKQEKVEQQLATYDETYGETNQDEDGWDEKRFDIEMSAPDLEIVEENNLYIEADIKPSGYGAWQFVTDNAGMLMVVTLLTIIIAAGMIAHEFRWGTIKLLLIRPISRTTILLSKYVTILMFGLITLLLVVIVAWISGAILFGVEGMQANMVVKNSALVNNGQTSKEIVSTYKELISSYGYGLIELIIMATFAFMISAVFRNSTLAVGTAVFLVFAGTTVTSILLAFDVKIAKYLLFTNMDLKQYADGEVFIEGATLGFSIAVLVTYYMLFMLISWLFFVRRDIV